jgi:hypothetical protein
LHFPLWKRGIEGDLKQREIPPCPPLRKGGKKASTEGEGNRGEARGIF